MPKVKRASPAMLETALRSHKNLSSKVKVYAALVLKGSKTEESLAKARSALAHNEERIRLFFLHILTKTFSGGRILCSTQENADRLRLLYVEAVTRGIVHPLAGHEILDKASDNILCLAVQSGHSLLVNDSIVALIKRHRRSIEAFKRKQFGLSPEEIDVRCQEAVWRSAKIFDPNHASKAKFSTHLYRWLNRNSRARTKGDKGDFLLAREEGMAVISSSRADANGDAVDLFDTIVVDRAEEEVKVDKKTLGGALRKIGKRQRQVLELHFYRNFTIEMASAELGISIEDVVKDIEEGLASMKEKLAPSL